MRTRSRRVPSPTGAAGASGRRSSGTTAATRAHSLRRVAAAMERGEGFTRAMAATYARARHK